MGRRILTILPFNDTFLIDVNNNIYKKRMRYLELRKAAEPFTVFSLRDIRQVEPAFDRRRLNEWQEKNYIRKVIKGYYVFADTSLDEKILFEIANRIYAPSYVSFEMALAYYGLIPESVYGVTSAATRKTMAFKTPLGEFTYRKIHAKLYFGFEYLNVSGKHCKIASAEKALLDYFYLNSGIKDEQDFTAMRVNRDQALRAIDRGKMMRYAAAYAEKSFQKRIAAFWEYLEHA